MAQPWGVSAMESTTQSHKNHGSVVHGVAESIKNSITPESSAETKRRNERLEQEHSVPQSERNAAYASEHHVGGTNLTVEQGTHGDVRHDVDARRG